jgi:phosphoglycolate phosphatase-like HAD superfamily hydrolase
MIRNLIWDVDGTLFDTYPSFAKAFNLAMNDLGDDVPLEWITAQALVSIDFCVHALAERYHREEDSIGERFAFHYGSITPQDQPPFEGVLEICEYIVGNGGKNLIVTHRRSAGLISLLDAFNMRQYFSGWTTADDNYPRKPDPAAFLDNLAKHHLIPAETLAVGDRDIDILAGQAAGLPACLFGDPLPTCEPELIIQQFKQFQEWLYQH